jgi:hypothetical protein
MLVRVAASFLCRGWQNGTLIAAKEAASFHDVVGVADRKDF